jgi:Xaa-Pro aminopeptidase
MPVLIDCGAKYKGYCADISESFWFGKKPSEEYKTAHCKVECAIEAIEGKLKSGVKGKDLWKESEKYLKELPHALGHGIGLEEHDAPGAISAKSNWTLKKGMILAIEPAIYSKKFGVRIERDYLILNKGFEEL